MRLRLITAAIIMLGGLLFCGCTAMTCATGRGGSLGRSGGRGRPNDNVPGWPRRRQYLLLALFFTAAAIYGSLVPLSYSPRDFHEAIEAFKQVPYLNLSVESRADWVANILLFIPISYLWLGVFLVDRRFGVVTILAVPCVISAAAATSIALEFTQLWFPPRTVSLNDIVAETLGSLIGATLWLMTGQAITDWVRSYTTETRPRVQIDWLLEAYFFGLVVYCVMPLDLTIKFGELADKYREGKILLVPFAGFGWGFQAFYELFRDIVVFIPVGLLVATWLTPARRPVRPIGTSVLLGGLVVAGMELAQLFVYSRFTATEDVLTGTLGVWVGAWIMRRWRGGGQEDAPPPVFTRSVRRACLWLLVAGVYTVFLAVVFCAPFELMHDSRQLQARYEGFFRIPFASLYYGSEFNAISEVLKKILFYAPLGGLFALAAGQLSVPRPIRRILLSLLLMVAAGVATSIEMAQVFLPPHVPDVTDVILCSAGAAMGMLVTVRIIDARGAKA